MARRFLIVAGKVGPAFDSAEERARARYLRERLIGGSNLAVTDWFLYPPIGGSAELRAKADAALVVELEGSVKC